MLLSEWGGGDGIHSLTSGFLWLPYGVSINMHTCDHDIDVITLLRLNTVHCKMYLTLFIPGCVPSVGVREHGSTGLEFCVLWAGDGPYRVG